MIPVVAADATVDDCYNWAFSLPIEEQRQAPVQTVIYALGTLKRKPCRGTRNSIQSLAKTWHVEQKQNNKKVKLPQLKDMVSKRVIQETRRLSRLRASTGSFNALGALIHNAHS